MPCPLRSLPTLFAVALGLILLSMQSDVRAGGILVAQFGGENAHAASEDATSLYYNPAAVALGHGTRLYLEGVFAWRTASYDRPREAIDHIATANNQTGTPQSVVSANAGKATLGNPVVAPF